MNTGQNNFDKMSDRLLGGKERKGKEEFGEDPTKCVLEIRRKPPLEENLAFGLAVKSSLSKYKEFKRI